MMYSQSPYMMKEPENLKVGKFHIGVLNAKFFPYEYSLNSFSKKHGSEIVIVRHVGFKVGCWPDKMKKQNKKEFISPVAVSGCTPVYNNGRIIGYNVHVFYDGDLSTNTEIRESWRDLIDSHPHLVWDNMNMLRPVIKTNIIIPNKWHLTGYFEYHHESDTSELEYGWRKGLFGCGAKRAWQFRLKMLAKVKENNK